MSGLGTVIFVVGSTILILGLLVRAARRIRRSGDGLATVVRGATYDLLNSDKRRSSEAIVSENAGVHSDDDAPGQSEDPSPGKV